MRTDANKLYTSSVSQIFQNVNRKACIKSLIFSFNTLKLTMNNKLLII